VLRGSEPLVESLFLAPTEEPPQVGAELEELAVLPVGRLVSLHRNIS
jgi:hypothetical protein